MQADPWPLPPPDHARHRSTILFPVWDDEILLGMKRRGSGAGWWNGAGGKVEPHETPLAAAIRETVEELNIVPRNPRLAGTLAFAWDPESPDHVWHYSYVYLAEVWTGEPEASDELLPRWFPRDRLPLDEMWEADRYWLPKLLGGAWVEGVFLYDNDDRLIWHEVRGAS